MNITIVTKSDIQHTVRVLSKAVEPENNDYTKSVFEEVLRIQKLKFDRWDDRQGILDDFVKLVKSHNVYSELFDVGYGDGSETTWFVDGKPITDSIRFLDVDIYENYDVLINETDERVDSSTKRTYYSYKANDDDNQ